MPMTGVASDINIMEIDIGVNWMTAVDKYEQCTLYIRTHLQVHIEDVLYSAKFWWGKTLAN